MSAKQFLLILPLCFVLAACQANKPTSSNQPEEPKEQTISQPVIKQEPAPSKIEIVNTVKDIPSVNVALFLPLSGPSSDLGQDMLKAAEMALFTLDGNVNLKPYDTSGAALVAKKAAQQALDDKVDIIIGPVYSSATDAVAEVVDKRIPIISFSNRYVVAEDEVYILGFNPLFATRSITEFAYLQGYRKFSAFLPENETGDALLETYRQTLAELNLEPEHVITYRSDDQSFLKALRTLTTKHVSKENEATLLLVAEGGRVPRAIVNNFASYNPDANIRMAGTGVFDNPAIYKDTTLLGHWFVSSKPADRKMFEVKYKALYGKPAPRLASVIYDAVSLASILQKTNPDEPFADAYLTNERGFAGLNGAFRFNTNGMSERILSILEITDGTPKVLGQTPPFTSR